MYGGINEILPHRASGHCEGGLIEKRGELFHERACASGCLEVLDGVGTVGPNCAQHGNPGAELVEESKDIDVDAGLHGGRLQMLDAVDRAADAQHRGYGVPERAGCQNVTRFEVFAHHLDDAPPGLARFGKHRRTVRQHGCAPGQ